MTTDAEYAARQEAYEERYWAMMDAHRPKTAVELTELRTLARKVGEGDASAALDFAVKCTPENFLTALAAEKFDRDNPFYTCRECCDGKKLPKGYMCQACGENNDYEGSW